MFQLVFQFFSFSLSKQESHQVFLFFYSLLHPSNLLLILLTNNRFSRADGWQRINMILWSDAPKNLSHIFPKGLYNSSWSSPNTCEAPRISSHGTLKEWMEAWPVSTLNYIIDSRLFTLVPCTCKALSNLHGFKRMISSHHMDSTNMNMKGRLSVYRAGND